MASNRNRRRQRATLIGSLVGLVIIFSFVITLIAPDLGTRSNTVNDDTIFNTPEPTDVVVPPPNPNPQVASAAPFIHSSGIFRTFQPAGSDWVTTESGPTETNSILRVVQQSADQLAVIHNYIQPGVEFEALTALSEDFLTTEHFQGAWSDYASWTETERTVTDESVIVNFVLAAQSISYNARSVYWTADGWLYATHIVVPAEHIALLDLLTEQATGGFEPIPAIANRPFDWPAFIDQPGGYILKYPSGWERVAGDVGRPATFANPANQNDLLIRTWTVEDTPIDSVEAAADWLAESKDNATVLSSEPIERWAGTGYSVAYTFTDTAGDPRSGLILLLNDEAGNLFLADLQTELLNTDLLDTDELPATVSAAREAVGGGFVVLPQDVRSTQRQ